MISYVCVHGRHEELVSEGGVYADMWLQQQKAEEKEKQGSISDSDEKRDGETGTDKWNTKHTEVLMLWLFFKYEFWF